MRASEVAPGFHGGGAAGLALGALTLLSAALGGSAMASEPRQAWAHKEQLVDLQLQGAATIVDPGSYLQIQQAFARFGMAYDEGRSDVIGSLFTEDAVVEVGDGHAKPFERSTGRAAIMRQFSAALAQQGDQRRHLISNVLVERFSAVEASALAYGVVTVAADGLYVGASVIYRATLRREQDRPWRFSTLFIGIDSYVGKKPKVTD
jgi:hypothetical protein